jgi:phage anti-repressor protein
MQLIPIKCLTIGNTNCNGASARDVHTQLEVKKDFSNWIKAQIKTLDLIENVDYLTVAQKGEGGKFGKTEYYITIDTAKHIAMASRTAKGREVRNYFISIEKDFLQKLQTSLAVKDGIIATYEKTISQLTTRPKPKSLEWEHKEWTNRDDQEIMHLKHRDKLDTKRIAQKVKRNEDEVIIRLAFIQENPDILFKDY